METHEIFPQFLEIMLAMERGGVISYFSIPHGVSTFCLCREVGREDEAAGGKN